jgi:tetrahydromethanopterin S-methyltransferase subunit F
MQHIITSSTATTVRMRVEPARRARDQSNNAGEDALSGFKGIAVGVLLSVALWASLIGLYFLI